MDSGAYRKFGLSGTPLKDEELSDMKLIGATGEIICIVEATELIELGIAAKPKICVIYSSKVSGPDLPSSKYIRWVNGKPVQARKHLPYQKAYRRGVINNKHHNRAVIRAVEWLIDHDRRVMILCRLKDHWKTLRQMLDDVGINHQAVWGDTGTYEREDAKKLLDEGKIKAVLATTIFDEGEDLPGVDALVLAEGVKVSVNALQRVGRGMRKKTGLNEVWVVDICPTCHPTLSKHALQRVIAYEGEGYDVRVWEDWPDEDSEDDLLPFLTWDLTAEAS
jgi:superfamily II DNA or RNA helicase